MFVRFKKGEEGYKIWDSKYKKFILSRDATFDEASIVKLTNSQQVKSEKTSMTSQQVESDATLPALDSTILFEITPEVTQGGDYVGDEDVNDDENQGQVWVMSKILLR